MAVFERTVRVSNPDTGSAIDIPATIDTGATYTLLPANLLRSIGIQPHRQMPFELGDGRKVDLDVGWIMVRVDDREDRSLCIFGPDAASPLLGAYTLESLSLGVDPVNERLIPVAGRLRGIF